MKNTFFFLLYISTFFILTLTNSFAQDTSKYACPNFEFKKNILKGATDEDIYVLQQILNLDKRTIVAQTGPGSKGKETGFFGVSTRESLKRFQALFIEYIEVADGKFNDKTRQVINKVCQGEFFTGGTGNVFDVKDPTSPTILLEGPSSTKATESFRVKLVASEPIKNPEIIKLSTEGANANDLRKISPNTFSFLVIPNEDVTDKIILQFEAESVEDLSGNKNQEASNELVISVFKDLEVASTSETSMLDNILNSISSNLTPTEDCSKISSVNIYDYNNPCYGRVPMSDPNSQQISQSEQGKKESQLGQMLQGLMMGLTQTLLGRLRDAGGSLTATARCGCTGLPTSQFGALKGTSGRQLINGVTRGLTSGQFVGRQGPPPGICGVRPRSNSKDPCAGIPGPHNASCCGILYDVTGQPVTGSLFN